MAETIQDSREKNHAYDINKVDFEWVEQQTNAKELHMAYQAIKEDGGFFDLERALENKLKSLDPVFKKKMDSGHITNEEQKALNEEIHQFLNEMN